MSAIQPGNPAPDFTLETDAGQTFRLADHRGSFVVVYFYPKDDTPACTTEAASFSALEGKFEAAGCKVVGISPDTPESHKKFRRKHDLTVALASDPDHAVAQAYGVWVEKSMYGRKYMGIERTTFLIAPDGRVLRVWEKVKVAGHAEEVLAAIESEGR